MAEDKFLSQRNYFAEKCFGGLKIILVLKDFRSKKFCLQKFWVRIFFVGAGRVNIRGGGGRANVGRGRHQFGLVRLFAKFKTSRMYPSGIFWCGCSCSCSCSCCDRGKTKSTPSPKTWDWSLTKKSALLPHREIH